MLKLRIFVSGAFALLFLLGSPTVPRGWAAQASNPSEPGISEPDLSEVDAGGVSRARSDDVLADASAPKTPAAEDSSRPGVCQVSLSRLSADDPGADDAEFLELLIDRDANESASCRLPTLALLNGGSGGCEPYRTLDLSEFDVTIQRYVVICSSASAVHEDVACDVTSAGGKSLPNGWLQNGPDDAIAILDQSGNVSLAFHYGATGGGCSGELEGTWLPEEKGEIDGADDVIVNCGAHFERLAFPSSPLRGEPKCQQGSTPEHDTSDAGAALQTSSGGPATTQQAQSAVNDTEVAPESTSVHYFDAGPPLVAPAWGRILDGSVLVVNEPRASDAAIVARPAVSGRGQTSPPPQVGCSVSNAPGSRSSWVASTLTFRGEAPGGPMPWSLLLWCLSLGRLTFVRRH